MMTKNEIMNAMINLSEKECDELLDSLLSRKERRAAIRWLKKEVNKIPQEDKEDFTAECLSDLTEEGFKNVVTTYYKDNLGLVDATFDSGIFVTNAKNIKEAGINRDYNKEVLKKLRAELGDGIGLIKGMPILVYFDKDLNCYCIIDGHHRHYILEELDMPIYFTIYKMGQPISREEARAVMIKLNQAMKNWIMKNYEQSYLKSGNENYLRMKEFEEFNKRKYNLYFESSRAVLKKSYKYSGNGTISKAVKNGYLEVTEEDITVAQKKIDKIAPVIDAILECGYLEIVKRHRDRCFTAVLGIEDAMEILFDVDHLAKNIRRYRCPFQENDSIDNFIKHFIALYNYDLGKLEMLDYNEVNKRLKTIGKASRKEMNSAKEEHIKIQAALVASIREN